VPPEFVSKWIARLDELKDEVSAILKEEKEEKQVRYQGRGYNLKLNQTAFQLRQAEMELKKGENMIEHKEEIYSRAPRTWFRDTKEKAQAKGYIPPLLSLRSMLSVHLQLKVHTA
jgi:ATP-dependent RNA helicase DDX27